MNIHIYVFGPPDVGKTAGVEYLLRIMNVINRILYKKYSYAFNSSTTPSDIFGEDILIDGQMKFIDGPLTESLLKGHIFIADNMNLSSKRTMMSLMPIFNNITNRPIYYPGIEIPIIINQNFLLY